MREAGGGAVAAFGLGAGRPSAALGEVQGLYPATIDTATDSATNPACSCVAIP